MLYERGDEAGAAEVQAQLDELRRAHQRKLEAEDDKENAEDAGSGDGEADAQGEEADAPEKPDRDTPR